MIVTSSGTRSNAAARRSRVPSSSSSTSTMSSSSTSSWRAWNEGDVVSTQGIALPGHSLPRPVALHFDGLLLRRPVLPRDERLGDGAGRAEMKRVVTGLTIHRAAVARGRGGIVVELRGVDLQRRRQGGD